MFSFLRQEGRQDLESHVLLVSIAVGAPLNHADLVIQSFDEPQLDLVAAEGDGEVRVGVNADALVVSLESRAGGARLVVVEADVVVSEVADSLHPRPAGLGGAEELPGEVEHAVALAEAAREQEDQRLVGQDFLDGCWRASGTYGSGRPLSRITVSVEMRIVPAGAVNRPHQLPKPSR